MADVGFQMDQSELNEAELASLNPKSDYLKSDIRYILFPSMIFTFCRRYADALALLALALICAVIFWPLWHGQAYYLGDIQLYFQPMATQWKAALDGGRVPLWNNGILAGTPFVGNPQIWVLYPASLLFLAFPAMQALALTTLFHFWLAGAFFYGWTRRGRLDLHPVAAFLGACVWMLCGFFVAKTQFPNMFMAIAWMPAVLWAGEGVIERGSARATLVLSLVLGLQLATAHAQISLFTIYMMGAYALYLWRATPHPEASRRGNGWRVAALFGGALLLMGLLTLGQTLPVVDVVRAAARQKLGLRRASRFIFVPWAIITLVWPYFYGDPMKDSWNYPLYMNIWETVAYLGIAPLVLVGVAVVNDLRARFWLNWSLIFLWLSMGLFGGLYILVFKLLPGINRFHDPARFLSGYSLGVAVLAALGAHYLWKHARRGRWLALGALAFTLADAGYFARHFYPFLPDAVTETKPVALWGDDPLMKNRQARFFMPNYGDVWGGLQKYDKWRVGDRENTRRLYQSSLYNRHLLGDYLADSGYEPLFDMNTGARIGALAYKPEDTRFDPKLAAQMGRVSIRSLQLFRKTPLPATADMKLVYTSPWKADDRRFYIYQNEKCLPRARFQVAGDTGWQMARIVKEDTRSIQLEVPANAQTFELADSMHPGWSATVDGTPVSIEQTAEGFRRLKLPAITAPIAAATPTPNALARTRGFRVSLDAVEAGRLGVAVRAGLCQRGFGGNAAAVNVVCGQGNGDAKGK